jgi:hypothetical protein
MQGLKLLEFNPFSYIKMIIIHQLTQEFVCKKYFLFYFH